MKTDSTEKPDCPLCAARWNPYLVGAGIGVLSMAVFWLADNPLGISTGLSQASGACAATFMGWEKVGANAYWAKHVPKWDYGTLFLVGTLLGGLASAVLGKSFRVEAVPMLAIVLGSAIFGVGMVIYGYCPGTGLAAIGTGSLHALAGVGGMLGGGILYALTFPWVAKNILPIADIGKMTLDQLLTTKKTTKVAARANASSKRGSKRPSTIRCFKPLPRRP